VKARWREKEKGKKRDSQKMRHGVWRMLADKDIIIAGLYVVEATYIDEEAAIAGVMMIETRSGNIDGLKRKRDIYAIDLFCGAGGLTHGLARSGVKVRVGVDIDPHCGYPYTANNDEAKFILKSVEELHAFELSRYYRKRSLKLLAGCAPCQTFSTYNQKANDSDKRWWLLNHFSRLVEELSPELVTMENVPALKEQNVFKKFVADLERMEYAVKPFIVNCEEYGIPQHRSRLVLLASKFGPVELISPEAFGRPRQTVKDAISNLPPIKAGTNHPNDPLHLSSSLSPLNMKRMKNSKPGGTWRDWPETLIADCHKKHSGKTYPSVYGRMTWDDPAPTITTEFFGFGNGRFGHPKQNRAISLREGAILQSFPPEYQFVPPGEEVCLKAIGRLIGNAVPVTLGEVIGKSLFLHASNLSLKEIASVKASDK
jgi:DNA (cytosine-5)-methyltransferase 1